MLRRARLKPSTRVSYEKMCLPFCRQHGLTDSSAAAAIDNLVDRELVSRFLSGDHSGNAARLFYSVRWWLCVTNSLLPKSYQSLRGHLRLERGRTVDPECWEAGLLQVHTILESQ